jgi:2-succinyl-6-hydroxy-2,4-cyclohexadiene-1-carboxylate synthase
MPPTVLLLHGFTHTSLSWQPVVAALGESYRSLTPDIRGHGTASDARPVTLDAVLEDLEALVRVSGLTLVGYSMGGRIALHCALAWPDRVRRLMLIGASPGLADPAEREQRQADDERLADEIEGSTIDVFARRWAQTPVLAGLPPAARERANADRLRNSPAGLARALRGLGTGALPSLWERLGELEMPTTLVVGERDEKFRRIGEAMAQTIPKVELVVVPGSGHAVHLEAPETVAQIIAGG